MSVQNWLQQTSCGCKKTTWYAQTCVDVERLEYAILDKSVEIDETG